MNSELIIVPSSNERHQALEKDNIYAFSFLTQSSLSPATRKSYEKVIRDFFTYFAGSGIKGITSVHINLYLKKIEKGTVAKNFILKVLSSFFGFMQKSGYVALNPAALLKPEKVADKFKFKILDREQVQRLIDFECDLQKKLLLKILYLTGLRISEALSLKKDSFRAASDGIGAFMTVIGKGTKVRTVFIPEVFYQEIENYIDIQGARETSLFFDKELNKPLSRFQAVRIVKSAAKKAKVNPIPSPHWLRHSSATHSIEAGAPIHVVQATLGHASINTTGKYLHASVKDSNASFLLKADRNRD